jgi:hypothetical protein
LIRSPEPKLRTKQEKHQQLTCELVHLLWCQNNMHW